MAEKPDTRPPEAAVIPFSDIPHTPFIYYDAAPVSGYMNGIISLTLSASRPCVGPDGALRNDQIVVAYLRGNIQAAANLRKAIDTAILMASPTKEGTAN